MTEDSFSTLSEVESDYVSTLLGEWDHNAWMFPLIYNDLSDDKEGMSFSELHGREYIERIERSFTEKTKEYEQAERQHLHNMTVAYLKEHLQVEMPSYKAVFP